MSTIEIRRDAERDPDGRHLRELFSAIDSYAVAGFAAVGVGSLVAFALEQHWLRIQRRSLAENHGRIILDRDGRG